ncbi:MAG TPA: serine hydrolase domain-containing protein [Gemmatimonadaceae bacterium]
MSPALIKLSSARQIESVLLAADRGVDPPSSELLQSLPLLMDVAEVPGIGMSVVREGRVVWQHHAGIADIKTRKPVSTDTLWPAASLGKPVFALAVLRLVDEKKIDLDTPLSRYLPGYTPNEPRANRITARHVLSHSSGLPNWRDDDSEQLVPQFEPGSRFRYSGEGFFYLERVVEHVVGAPFEQFMEQSVFASLGMTSSTYTWRADMPSRVVAGHDRDQSYTVFWQRLGVQLLDDAMLSPQIRIDDALAWGLGWGLERRSLTMAGARSQSATNANFIWHWGDNGSWKNFVLAHPATRSAIVIFTNGSRGLHVAQRIVSASTGLDHAAFWWL